MWCRLNSRVSNSNINALLTRTGAIGATPDSGEIAFAGKEFFYNDAANGANLDLLRQLHLDIWPEIRDIVKFDVPVVDHCYLLFKSPGGRATRMHQDRPYWIKKEPQATIISVWIALDAITADNGGLSLVRENQVDVSDMSSFNSGTVLDHEEVELSDGSFPLLIREDVAKKVAETMVPVDMGKGDVIAFDSFEPHMANANTTDAPRLGMKIAYADKGIKKHYLVRVDELESGTTSATQ